MVLLDVNGSRLQLAQRSLNRSPAIRAMRSSSLGHAYRWATGNRRTPSPERHMALIDVLPHGIVAQYIESDLIDFYRFGIYVLIVAQAVKETGH